MADMRLIDMLAADIRQVDKLAWPGKEQEIGILALRCDEIEDAEVDARTHLRKRGIDVDALSSADLLSREFQVQLAYRMMVEPDSKGQAEFRLFKSADELRKRLDPDSRGYFVAWAVYNQQMIASGYAMPPDDEEAAE